MKNLRGEDVQKGILWILQLNLLERLETYWMHELRTIFPHGLNDRIGGEFKTDNEHIYVAAKFSSLPRKYSRANPGKNHKGVPRCKIFKPNTEQ